MWYRLVRGWSPALVPPLLSGLLLIGAAIAFSNFAKALLVTPHAVLMLLVIYVAFGIVYGSLLYLAPGTLAWWGILAGGLVVYVLVTFGMLAGLIPTAAAALVFVGLGVAYVRVRARTVPNGKLGITRLAGAYHRTFFPGTSILVPGERVVASVDTGEQSFNCPTQRAELRAPDGHTYLARASATVAYSLIPREAYRVVLASEQWQRDLHDLVGAGLRHALGEWGSQVLASGTAPSDRMLARTLLSRLREQVSGQGIRIIWVSVRDIWIAPQSDAISPAESRHAAAAGVERETTLPPARERASEEPAPAVPAPEQPGAAPASLAPEVLADAYEAVRAGNINDPATIREIANAFLRVMAEPQTRTTFPYDAVKAAEILLERATTLEQLQRPGGRP